MKIIIGARGSALSLKQTEIVKSLILKKYPKTEIEIKIITTKGDTNLSPIPLDTVGKGWFTKELDKALIDNRIDVAVHSLKDITESLNKNLLIAAIPKRDDPRDVLVSRQNLDFDKLTKGAVIGTDSLRRKSQLLHLRPDLKVISIRGNIDTRLSKLFNKNAYDGLILAAAGLKRLGLEKVISQYFPAKKFIPAPGQGALAVVVNKNNKKIIPVIKAIEHAKTRKEVDAERAFSLEAEGGCKTPSGAYATLDKNKITILAMVATEDGKYLVRKKITGPDFKNQDMGIKLAKEIILKSKNFKSLENKTIVVTRPKQESKIFKKKLKKLKFNVYELPTIKTISNLKNVKKELTNINSFDLIIFTSSKGVDFFIEGLRKLKINKKVLENKRIAAVGLETSKTIEKYGLKVNFIPSKFTSLDLAEEIKNVKNKNVLIPRTNIGEKEIVDVLKNKGALITDINVYKTIFIEKKDKKFESLVKKDKINFITFTSPSTVNGFFKRVEGFSLRKKLLSIPVISIGPVTTKIIKRFGFLNVFTAEKFTTDGIINKLLEVS